MVAAAAVGLAGRLAPLIAKGGAKFSTLLGAGRGAGVVSKATDAAVKTLGKKGVAEFINRAGPEVITESVLGTIATGNPIQGLGAGASSLGVQGGMAYLAGKSGVPSQIRGVLGSQTAQQIAGGLAAGTTTAALGRAPANTLSAQQHLEHQQLMAQAAMQAEGNALNARNELISTVLNAPNTGAAALGQAMQYGPADFTSAS
jgi:hypothetical protein